MPFPINPSPGDTYTDEYGTIWVYAGSVNGWYRQTVFPDNETTYTTGGGGNASATGNAGEIQYTDGTNLAASPDLTWDDSAKELGVGGDITLTGRFISSLNGAASAPPGTFTGSWFTGGTSTTTKPQLLIEPTGTTSTAWSTSGTGLGVNAPSGFAGNLLDLQVNGSSLFSVDGLYGAVSFRASSAARMLDVTVPGDGLLGRNLYQLRLGHTSTNNYDIGRSFATGYLTFYGNQPGANGYVFSGVNGERLRIRTDGDIQLNNAIDVILGTTTGTKIGTATTQKLGFYGATPVIQPTAVADATDAASVITQLNALLARMRDLGLIAT
jgi:hypothetical protein